jgi:hypothetical protein
MICTLIERHGFRDRYSNRGFCGFPQYLQEMLE